MAITCWSTEAGQPCEWGSDATHDVAEGPPWVGPDPFFPATFQRGKGSGPANGVRPPRSLDVKKLVEVEQHEAEVGERLGK